MKNWTAADKALARAVFGRPARVLLAAWVLDQGSRAFHQTEALDAVSGMGEARSAVAQELARFVKWGLLDRSEPGPSERRVMYAADKEQTLWDVFEAATVCFGLRSG